MIVVVYSPTKGFFIGCEPGGFGGVEGDPEFSHDPYKAINLANERKVDDKEFEACGYHLGYIRLKTPDAFMLRGKRADLQNLAIVHKVMEI